MILLINTNIRLTGDLQGDTSEYVTDALAVLYKMGVTYVESIEEGVYWTVDIYQQKCTLDEFCMNELFHDGFNELMDLSKVKLSYAWLGGAGCDFSVEMKYNV